MWFFNRRNRACRAFEAHLEDYLEALEAGSASEPGPALAAHLAACAACREALDLAREAGPLIREAAVPLPESLAANPYFAARVSARIREHAGHSGEFLPQLESVSLRLLAYAMSLVVLLGALSVSGVTRSSQPPMARLRPADPRAVSPELNPAPANPDDVVIALLSSERGREPR
jgi:predicted anti-sigma-YlaC factor YlaD